MGGPDWRALLSQSAAASVVVKKSPFDVKQRDAGVGTGRGGTTPASSAAADAQQEDTTEQPEAVVPIVLLKAAMPQQPVNRFVRSKVPEDPLRKLRELQQLISDSLAAAAAEVAKQGELKAQQQQELQQQQQQVPDIDYPYLRRPVPPPQHAANQDDCYFWSGSRTSQYSDRTTAAAAGTAEPGADQDRGPSSSTQHHAAGSSRGDPGVTGAQSMDTSTTTRVPASQGLTEVFSTARSPAEKWGSALLRLKQLQLETVEALDVQD